MKLSFFIFYFIFFTSFSQEIVSKFSLDADEFIGIDNLEHVYYIKSNVLYKKTTSKIHSFSNLHLGKITSVDIINPLKIVVFYKDFNSVIIVDDKLNELTGVIDFNSTLLKNISYVSTATESNLWLYSEDDNRLEIFNYISNKVIFSKQLENDFQYQFASSNYHNFWLISNKKILQYNEYGSYIKSFNIENIIKLVSYRNILIYQTKNGLFQYSIDDELKSTPIKLLSSDKLQYFSLNNNLIYFFDENSVFSLDYLKNQN